MRGQTSLILALVAALLIAIFSVLNVESVSVNFLFVETMIPLIIVILASTLLGGLMVGAVGAYRQYRLAQTIRMLKRTIYDELGKEKLEETERKIMRDIKGDFSRSQQGKTEEVKQSAGETTDQSGDDSEEQTADQNDHSPSSKDSR